MRLEEPLFKSFLSDVKIAAARLHYWKCEPPGKQHTTYQKPFSVADRRYESEYAEA